MSEAQSDSFLAYVTVRMQGSNEVARSTITVRCRDSRIVTAILLISYLLE